MHNEYIKQYVSTATYKEKEFNSIPSAKCHLACHFWKFYFSGVKITFLWIVFTTSEWKGESSQILPSFIHIGKDAHQKTPFKLEKKTQPKNLRNSTMYLAMLLLNNCIIMNTQAPYWYWSYYYRNQNIVQFFFAQTLFSSITLVKRFRTKFTYDYNLCIIHALNIISIATHITD